MRADACGDDDPFQDLPPARRAELDRRMLAAQYPAGHVFYAPEDNADRLLLLKAGRVRVYKLSPEGRALTLHILEPGALFGELAAAENAVHDSFAEALTDCSVAELPRTALRRLLSEFPQVALRLMGVISTRLRALEHKLADIAFHSVPQRLASALLNLCHAALPGQAPSVARFTHQQLAEMIGAYRETVTKVVGEFREAGLIRIEGDIIILADLPRLERMAAGEE